MNTQKGFSNLLGFLLIVIVLGGGVYLYQTRFTKNSTELVLENETLVASTTDNSIKNNKQDKIQANNSEINIFSAKSILENIRQKYLINSKIETKAPGYHGDTVGYRLVVKVEDISKIENYFKSNLSLKISGASELGYTFEGFNREGKVVFECETSTGRPEIETDEGSGFSSATEAFVYCWDMDL